MLINDSDYAEEGSIVITLRGLRLLNCVNH